MRGIGIGASCIVALGLLAGSAVGVVGQDEASDAMAPAWVTGTISYAPSCEDPTITDGDDGVSRERGYLCTPQTWASDDPRLGGVGTQTWNADVYRVDGQTYSITSGLVDVHDEDGGWTCSGGAGLDRGSGLFSESVQERGSISCLGYGANEGLRAILVTDLRSSPFTLEGFIFPSELPPTPELPMADPATASQAEADPQPSEEVATDAKAVTSDIAEPPNVATVIDVTEVDERTRDLTIASPSIGTKQVRLILPAGFDDEPDRTWPVLYLLHGQGGSHLDWTADTSITTTMAEELDALLVMPDAGAGYYSDWWNGGEGGQPMWETFHIDELLPILESDWRASDRRALMGVSMGGFGAMSYAARHPDLFGAAASLSGVLDPYGSDWGHDPALWGDKADQADIWRAHDPVTQAPALADTALYVWWGDGTEELGGPVMDGLEAYLAPHSAAFVDRLEELGIEATVESGPGVHGWASWDEAVLRALPVLRSALGG